MRRGEVDIILNRMKLVLRNRRSHDQPLVEVGREDVGSIPVSFGHPVELQPLQEEVDDDVIQERLVVQDEIVLDADGHRVAAGQRELTVLLVVLKR